SGHGEIDAVTATTHLFGGGGQAPIWNSYDISSMGLNITSGSVYIGTRYVPPANNVFTSADESGSVGFAGGYWWNNADGVWAPTQNAFPLYHSMFIRAVQTGGGGSPTPTPTGTPGGCEFHVLIAYSDKAAPTQLQSEIQAEPNVVAVDFFDAQAGTPTLAQLQQYEIVVPFSNFPFADPTTLGNNLADYVDGGGMCVEHGVRFQETVHCVLRLWGMHRLRSYR